MDAIHEDFHSAAPKGKATLLHTWVRYVCCVVNAIFSFSSLFPSSACDSPSACRISPSQHAQLSYLVFFSLLSPSTPTPTPPPVPAASRRVRRSISPTWPGVIVRAPARVAVVVGSIAVTSKELAFCTCAGTHGRGRMVGEKKELGREEEHTYSSSDSYSSWWHRSRSRGSSSGCPVVVS